jgi:hypothetical protein
LFNPPQSNVIAGEKLQTFSAAGDEGLTDRVRLEERRNRFCFLFLINLICSSFSFKLKVVHK